MGKVSPRQRGVQGLVGTFCCGGGRLNLSRFSRSYEHIAGLKSEARNSKFNDENDFHQ